MSRKIALDTNAYRALDDGNEEMYGIIRTTPDVGLPITVLGELYYGIFLGSKVERNLSNLDRFLSLPRVSVLQIDDSTARLFGEIAVELRRLGHPIQQDDMWIAAVCKQHGYALATADKDFGAITGLEIIGF